MKRSNEKSRFQTAGRLCRNREKLIPPRSEGLVVMTIQEGMLPSLHADFFQRAILLGRRQHVRNT